MATFTVYGNWGTLTVDAKTGNVLSYNHDDSDWEKPGDGYEDITRFDVERWQQDNPDLSLDGGACDILDFGFWYHTEDGERYVCSARVDADDALGSISHMPDDNTH